MPGMDISGHGRQVALNDRHLFKAHKTLPRKRDLVLDPALPTAQVPSVDQLSSSVPNGIAYPGAPNLPLTPPSLPPDSQGDIPGSTSQEAEDEHSFEDSGSVTPTRQFNPLTPDVTPPPAVTLLRKREGQSQIHPSMSSRAESFTTAREALSSDDEVERRNATNLPSLRSSKQRLPHPLRTNTLTDDSATNSHTGSSTNSTPQKHPREKTDSKHFDSFDGQWIGRQESSPRRYEKGNKTLDKNRSPNNNVRSASSPHRDWRVREMPQASQHADKDPTIQKFAADIGWLDSDDQVDGAGNAQSWRLSGVSTTSTIEAMVIDSPPQKRRTLRHTGKNISLRSASSPVPRSQNRVQTSSDDVESPPRLSHRPARLSNQDRQSIASDISFTPSVASSQRKQKEEVIPVVVIPQRRSSLRSSAPTSRNQSRSRSISSAKRPTTAPNGSTKASEAPRKRRTMSESFSSRNSATRGNTMTGPKIPARRSSLSAPTSANNSRTVSVTSNTPSFQPPVHVAPPSQKRELPRASESAEATRNPTDAPPPPAIRVADQDPFGPHHTFDEVARFQSPSLPPLTPFQPSIQSLSPGPVEINEARAVPFFAHNNESITVVEGYPQAAARVVQGRAVLLPHGRLDADGPRTPVAEFHKDAEAAVDSPLRNPRAPPKPPVSERPDTRRDDHVHESSTAVEDGGPLVRRWSSLRRALSARRQSEINSIHAPSHRVRNRKAGKDIDSNQQSFWSPRAFWDDVKDSDPDASNNPPQTLNRATGEQRDESNTFIGNSLGIPQNKVVFQGPLSLIRRVSNRARGRRARQVNLSHASLASSMLSRRSRRGFHYIIPRLGYILPLRSLKNTRERLSRTRHRRAEEKLEARRDKLKRKIGARVPIDDEYQTITTTLSRGNI